MITNSRVVLLSEDGTPELIPHDESGVSEELLYCGSNVRLVEQGIDQGMGTVYITSRRTVFVKQVVGGGGFFIFKVFTPS